MSQVFDVSMNQQLEVSLSVNFPLSLFLIITTITMTYEHESTHVIGQEGGVVSRRFTQARHRVRVICNAPEPSVIVHSGPQDVLWSLFKTPKVVMSSVIFSCGLFLVNSLHSFIFFLLSSHLLSWTAIWFPALLNKSAACWCVMFLVSVQLILVMTSPLRSIPSAGVPTSTWRKNKLLIWLTFNLDRMIISSTLKRLIDMS